MGDWTEESIQYRDNRHDHSTPEVPKRASKKKDTKKWCKGKVGRLHDWIVDNDMSWQRGCRWRRYKCGLCGKNGDVIYFNEDRTVQYTYERKYYSSDRTKTMKRKYHGFHPEVIPPALEHSFIWKRANCGVRTKTVLDMMADIQGRW